MHTSLLIIRRLVSLLALHWSSTLKIDTFDAFVVDQSGDAKKLMEEIYGVELGKTNAEKQLAGIRRHINHKVNSLQGEREQNDFSRMVEKGDGTVTTEIMMELAEGQNHKPQDIMRLQGFDPAQWELIRCEKKGGHWQTYSKQDGVNTLHTFKVELSVKPTQLLVTSDVIADAINNAKPPKLRKYEYSVGGMMMVLPIVDLHIGNLALDEKSGEKWNLDIAIEITEKFILDVLGRVKYHKLPISKIVLLIGNDYFHIDTVRHTTTRGTPLDHSGKWPEIYKRGVDLLSWIVEQLRSVAPVEALYVPGNHDTMLSYAAALHIDRLFSEIEEVTVNSNFTKRKYVEYGLVLLGASHGDEEGKRIFDVMQVDEMEAWGRTKFHEFIVAHKHKEDVTDEGGVVVRMATTFTETDEWHNRKGFIGATKKGQAFLYDERLGKQWTIDSTVSV